MSHDGPPGIRSFHPLVSNALNHKQGGSGSVAAQLQLLPATNRQRRQTRQLLPPQHLSSSPTPTRATLTGYPLGVHHAPTAHGTTGKNNHNAHKYQPSPSPKTARAHPRRRGLKYRLPQSSMPPGPPTQPQHSVTHQPHTDPSSINPRAPTPPRPLTVSPARAPTFGHHPSSSSKTTRTQPRRRCLKHRPLQ